MALIQLNGTNFEESVLKGEGAVLVDFYADWCGPCQMLGPIIHEIATENPDLTVGKINIDENHDTADKYTVMSIPTLLVFKNGKEVARMVGYHPKEEILQLLK